MYFIIKLGRHVNHGERMEPINFKGQRSRSQVTNMIYGNKLMNTIAIKPLCASRSNLADMLTMVRGWKLSPRNSLRWGYSNAAVVPCVRPSVRGPCEHDRYYTVSCFFVKLGRHVNHGERMSPIDFEGQRSRSQWTYMEISLWTR